MSYQYDSEDSEATRAAKARALVRDSTMSESKDIFLRMLATSLVLPIIPLAFLIWAPLWSKWTLPGLLGVITGWGGGFLLLSILV